MDTLEEARAKACCADLYQSELARMIMGDSMHPGGLALTNRMGRLMDIQPGDWVADLASARGNSAVAVSRVFKCNVVGIEFGREAVAEAHAAAINARLADRSYNMQGDAERPPLRLGRFDSAFYECARSPFQNKARAVEAKLGAFTAWQKMTGQQGPDPEMLERGPELLTTLRGLIQEGQQGYWLFVAENPSF